MFEAKLPNASLLKKIVDAIKDLVNDAPFDCTENSMSLQAMDASHVALVALKLENGLFDMYRCDRTINIGISVANLTRALKCANNDDSCMIRYNDEGDTVLFTFVDEKRDRSQDVTVKLMDIDAEQLGIPDQKYSAVIEMPSSEFQKTCRDLAMFSDSIVINATKGGVTFKATGDTGGSTLVYNSSASADDEDSGKIFFEVKEAVNVTFSIKYLNHFAKAASLSNRVRLSICNDVPIAIEYSIEDNGYLRFYLAPKIEDDQNMD
uniref:DNA sliding clamp PCNA n=1 Tax=Acrobeloides nanus TaxID=290746 RepID=A0A914DQ98_9BILA